MRRSCSPATCDPLRRSGILPKMFARRGQQAGPAEAGFTLLEVLVALAIAVPALVLLYRQGALAMGAARTAATYQEAISRAQSRLDALTGTGLAAGEEEGDDGGGFRWRTRIVPVASAPLPPHASSRVGGNTLYAVAVEILWLGPAGMQRFLLETRRLGAVPAGRS